MAGSYVDARMHTPICCGLQKEKATGTTAAGTSPHHSGARTAANSTHRHYHSSGIDAIYHSFNKPAARNHCDAAQEDNHSSPP